MRERAFWVLPHEKNVVTTALEASITDFLFTDLELHQECTDVAQFSSTCVDEKNQFPGGLLAPLTCPDDVDRLMHQAGQYDIVIIDPKEWTQIPTENLIASYQSSHTKLFAIVNSADEASTMLLSLQAGVDGCVLRTSHYSQIAPFAALKNEFQNKAKESLLQTMVSAKVTRIKAVGAGSRVCIDTCSILESNEGIMVGSSSQAMFLVLSEAAISQYCPSRPFRVNAGPVHAYCLLPDGKTKYLSEIKAGDEILIVKDGKDGTQSCRTAIVGRSKIESRPLLMLETVVVNGNGQTHHHNVFLQNAETVRVATVSGAEHGMKSVSALNIGDQLVLRTDNVARHIGMPISEDLVEK